MQAEFISPFIIASFSVLEMVLGNTPDKGDLTTQASTFTSRPCNIIYGVTGRVQGQVIYGMSLETSERIASTMLGGPITTFDELAVSAIGELGNMISGNALLHLAEADWACDITPPTIIRGGDVLISMVAIPSVVIPFTVEQGEIVVTIGLQARK